MKSSRTTGFRDLFAKLPQRIKDTAKKNYEIWKDNPFHPSLGEHLLAFLGLIRAKFKKNTIIKLFIQSSLDDFSY